MQNNSSGNNHYSSWDQYLGAKVSGYISEHNYKNKKLDECLFERDLFKFSPCNGKHVATIKETAVEDVSKIVKESQEAFLKWRSVPAPKRGEVIREYGNILRREKESLASLITIETGKTITESLGEVQEMIDICDFAVGLSRQLTGLTIASERKQHKLLETWHPVGPVAVISAFNFPTAVWAWNFALAVVCGNSVIWKPSEKTPVTAIVCHALFKEISPVENLSSLIIGKKEQSEKLVADPLVKLVSATGSTEMGWHVGVATQKRFGRFLLELGGNNAGIVTPSADLENALPSIVFGAVGTTGQRCTTLRRLFVHESIYDKVVTTLKNAYEEISRNRNGNPFLKSTIVGPLIDSNSWEAMKHAIAASTNPSQGGKLLTGGSRRVSKGPAPTGAYDWRYACREQDSTHYVEPAIVEMSSQSETVKQETFAPILYVMKYKNLEDAIALNNDVKQGLSSCIFTTDIREAELFLSECGSDCGIANVNIGTSGAEIGGAFGGEKETGGGRESGSDSWKNYMRRQTATINYSYSKPELAQGINFNSFGPKQIS